MNKIKNILKNGVSAIVLLPQAQFSNLTNITIVGLISAAVNLVLVVAALLFFFNFMIGGIKMILSGGNKDKMDTARRQIVNAVLGAVIVFSTWAIFGLIQDFYGINLLTIEIPRL